MKLKELLVKKLNEVTPSSIPPPAIPTWKPNKRNEELDALADSLWKEISISHNRWTSIMNDKRVKSLSPEELDYVKGGIRYHHEMTEKSMQGFYPGKNIFK